VRFSRIEQPRTHVYLAEQLRREITLGVLPTGEALPPERELAAMFGPPSDSVSRHRLITHVSRNRRLIEEAVTYRLEIEPAAAGEAARARTADDLADLRQIADRAAATTDDALFTSLDTQFHLAVATAAHNRFFAEAVERVRLSLYEAIMLLPESPLWQQRSLREHQRIFAGLEAGDPQAARQAMLTHVGHTARSLRALLKAL
jgi:DNA-binding FadR family transcriptional regulator